ncbi:MAG TPA: hypothetical protein PKD45_01270 [Flavobacteriales bacterium]|nr:hypothetical protein [Flavobacteriales bacterium]
MPLIFVFYFGEVGIEPWEWLMGAVYMMVLYLYFGRQKNIRIKNEPEYKHFLRGLFIKAFGALFFSLIYFYYYQGGDTISYFYSAVAMSHLAAADPLAFLSVLFGPNDQAHISLFSLVTVKPLDYVYYDSRTFMVIRFISPLVLLAFRSYVLTALLLASICYIGIWRCYQTFVRYYPSLMDKFAIAFLYMPSVVFWGSGIMKDTLTIAATCWWIHCFDNVFFKKHRLPFNVTGLVVAAFFLLAVKPYIFMVLMPVTVLWLMYYRVAKLKNVLFRVMVLPMALLIMGSGIYAVLANMGDQLGKFSLDEAMETTMNIQRDMQRSEEYGSNYFNVGDLDGTFGGTVKRFPAALNAALFRPYLWESRNVVMVLSALENTWLLAMALLMLWRTRVWFFLRCIRGNPMVMMMVSFTVVFGIIIGLTTPNFGALVRFKIPLVPLLVSAYYIVDYLNRERLRCKSSGRRFSLKDYIRGELPTVQAARSARTRPGHVQTIRPAFDG